MGLSTEYWPVASRSNAKELVAASIPLASRVRCTASWIAPCSLGIGRNAISGIRRLGIGLILLLQRWRLPRGHLGHCLRMLLQGRLQAFTRCIEFQRDIAFGSNTIMSPLALGIALILPAV
ncbi:hypothetical protein [Xanthomonas phaseoli]|nr:hypothetical protein [Xanthomonas phaseoli]